jgi:hypothetical protein
LKPKAIICYCLGELFWEIGRFAPHIIYKMRKQYRDQNVSLIAASRLDRMDIYGQLTSVFVPLRISGDGIEYKANCYRLDNYSEIEYHNLGKALKNQFSDRYDIIEVIYPKIDKNNFSNKRQFPQKEQTYKYFPRPENLEMINSYITTDKRLVVLAPRYRQGFRRNWPHWQKFYDILYSNKDLMNNFEFVICGKNPDCVSDEKNRFIDINNFQLNSNVSLIGLTIEILKKSILTIGSQSGIPNISLLFGTEVLEWGHQKHLHTVEYNIFKTKVTFLDDKSYDISPEKVILEMKKILERK